MRCTPLYLAILCLSIAIPETQAMGAGPSGRLPYVVFNNLSDYNIQLKFFRDNQSVTTFFLEPKRMKDFEINGQITLSYPRSITQKTANFARPKTPVPPFIEIKTFTSEELRRNPYILIYLNDGNDLVAEPSTPLHFLSKTTSAQEFLGLPNNYDQNKVTELQSYLQGVVFPLLFTPVEKNILLDLADKAPQKLLFNSWILFKDRDAQLKLEWENLVTAARIALGKNTANRIFASIESQNIDVNTYKEHIINLIWYLDSLARAKNPQMQKSTFILSGNPAEKVQKFLIDYINYVNPKSESPLNPLSPSAYQYPRPLDKTRYGIDIKKPLLPHNTFHIQFGFIEPVFQSGQGTDYVHIIQRLSIKLETAGIGIQRATQAILSKAYSTFEQFAPASWTTPKASSQQREPEIDLLESDFRSEAQPAHAIVQEAAPTFGGVIIPKTRSDAYVVLGLNPNATEPEIRKKYRSLALTLHPDKSSDPQAKEKMQALSAARSLLILEGEFIPDEK